MTLLSVVQDVTKDLGFPRPTSVINSPDPNTQQILAFVRKTARELNRERDWQVQTRELTFTAVATSSQGALSTLTADVKKLIPETMFNRTKEWPVLGARSASSHQQEISMGLTRVRETYRLRGDELFIMPTPTAGDTISLEYISSYWAKSAAVVDPETEAVSYVDRADFEADTDTFPIGEELLALGALYRFLQRKGFSYGEEFADYNRAVDLAYGADKAPGRLNQYGVRSSSRTRVQEGNFTL